MNEIRFGDCRASMRQFIAEGRKVKMCVTSPPYFGLRDYGTGSWNGGDPECQHQGVHGAGGGSSEGGSLPGMGKQKHVAGAPNRGGDPSRCICGAVRIDSQIGLEKTPDAYVAELVSVFSLVRDLLDDDGTLWLNLGDSYANDTKWGGATSGKHVSALRGNSGIGRNRTNTGLKSKDLIGIPWRVAFALQADGWYLRQDIIWHKPNPMPESVRDRCTKAHEYIFLLSKSEKYYYDQEAILEPCSPGTHARLAQNVQEQIGSLRANGGAKTNGNMKAVGRKFDPGAGNKNNPSFDAAMAIMPENRNRRSVWTVTTKPYKGAHFATFPPDLIEPCILAGSKHGDVVFDPFMGSGTTAQVAVTHGRQYLGCELNPEYESLQDERISAARRQPDMLLTMPPADDEQPQAVVTA